MEIMILVLSWVICGTVAALVFLFIDPSESADTRATALFIFGPIGAALVIAVILFFFAYALVDYLHERIQRSGK